MWIGLANSILSFNVFPEKLTAFQVNAKLFMSYPSGTINGINSMSKISESIYLKSNSAIYSLNSMVISPKLVISVTFALTLGNSGFDSSIMTTSSTSSMISSSISSMITP